MYFTERRDTGLALTGRHQLNSLARLGKRACRTNTPMDLDFRKIHIGRKVHHGQRIFPPPSMVKSAVMRHGATGKTREGSFQNSVELSLIASTGPVRSGDRGRPSAG